MNLHHKLYFWPVFAISFHEKLFPRTSEGLFGRRQSFVIDPADASDIGPDRRPADMEMSDGVLYCCDPIEAVAILDTGIAGIILAGGRSLRMGGGDKTLLPLGGQPMLATVAERLSPQAATVAINANGDPARFAAFRLPVIADTVEGFAGPLAGILSGIIWARSKPGIKAVVTVAGDTPFFPTNLVSSLLDARNGSANRIAVAASGGRRHPVFALWPLTLADALAEFLANSSNRSVAAFAASHDTIERNFPFAKFGAMTADPFLNINEPADLARAEALLQESLR
jgi:molybdenum cofactor guanylyltransferase